MNDNFENRPSTGRDGHAKDEVVRIPNARPPVRSGWAIPIIIFAFIALTQWPTLKELYYQLSGFDANQATIPWRHDFDSALNEAKLNDKPILAVFSAAWCPPCKIMKREVWPDEQVRQVVEANFVPVYVNVDEPEYAEVIGRYRVRSIPAVFILSTTGKVISRGGAMSRSQVLEFLAARSLSPDKSGTVVPNQADAG